ncbi:MAG: host specificity factor TipJ family phage tail protein [Reyranella sp.]
MGRVFLAPNPFDPLARQELRLRKPVTVRGVLRRAAVRRHTVVLRSKGGGRRVREFRRATICIFNGRILLRKDWSRTVVGPDDVVTFSAQLQGGGKAGGIIGIVLAVAIAVAAPYLAPMLGAALVSAGIGTAATFAAGSVGLGLLTAGIGLVLTVAAAGLMSLFSGPAPAPMAQAYSSPTVSGGAQASPTFSIGAQGNAARLGGAIPELMGRHMVYPDLAMTSYARYVDNEMYLHSLLVCTRGYLDIEQVRIGDTPVSSFEEIEWEKIEPGELGDPAICDPRYIPCRDLATVLLPASNDEDAPSAWKGPFAANPPGTIVESFEVDHVAPGGLYKYNSFGGFDAKSVTIEIEAQQIDGEGEALGDWTPIDTVTVTAAEQRDQRRTDSYFFPAQGRWQVRVRRTDAKDTSANARHEIQWVGLRGRLTTDRAFPGVTLLAVRMKATGDLNNQTSRQVNFIGTRRLPTWDAEAGAMTEALFATRCPCDGFAHIARTWNGDDKIDLAGLYAHREQFAEDGWTFDYIWDQVLPVREALQRVARAVVGVEVEQGGKICLVLDRPNDAPAMAFSMRNIVRNSLSIKHKMVDDQTADGASGTYIDQKSWKPVTVTEAYPDSPQRNVSNIGTEGITNRPQLRAVLWNRLRQNRLRRRVVSHGTEMEGLNLKFGDTFLFSHDLPRWGQTAEVKTWNAGTRTLGLTEPMTFTEGATHRILVRDTKGMAAGPFVVAAVEDDARKIVVDEEDAADLPTILTGGDRERTFIQFGPGESYAQRLKTIWIEPQDERHCMVAAVDDDPRMYEPIPEDTYAPPVGAPQVPLDIHVTEPVLKLNMRTLANAHGFSGNPIQKVTIFIDLGAYAWSDDPAVASVIRGSWPAGYTPRLIRLGGMYGAGGRGGSYAPGASVHGQNGGAALDARTGPLDFAEIGDEMYGGGGGGGAGGNSDAFGGPAGGGGGGGGRGYNDAAGGAGYAGFGAVPGNAGTAGSSASPGTGGTGGTHEVVDDEIPPTINYSVGGDGGDGGGWEQAGQAGSAGTNAASPPGNGGAAGPKILGAVRRIRIASTSAGIGAIGSVATGKLGRAGVVNAPIGTVAIGATAQLRTHGVVSSPIGDVALAGAGTVT